MAVEIKIGSTLEFRRKPELRTWTNRRIRVKPELTPVQHQLAALLTEGHSNKEIAARIDLSEGTVKVYITRMYQRVGINSRVRFAFWYRDTYLSASPIERFIGNVGAA